MQWLSVAWGRSMDRVFCKSIWRLAPRPSSQMSHLIAPRLTIFSFVSFAFWDTNVLLCRNVCLSGVGWRMFCKPLEVELRAQLGKLAHPQPPLSSILPGPNGDVAITLLKKMNAPDPSKTVLACFLQNASGGTDPWTQGMDPWGGYSDSSSSAPRAADKNAAARRSSRLHKQVVETVRKRGCWIHCTRGNRKQTCPWTLLT